MKKTSTVEVVVRIENEYKELTREVILRLTPSETEPGKHCPAITVRNRQTGFSLETNLNPVDCANFGRVLESLEERLKSPDVAEQTEKLFRRLAALMTLVR